VRGYVVDVNKQQLAKELVSGVMVELGYTQAVDVKLVANSQDNRKGHHGEDNNIYSRPNKPTTVDGLRRTLTEEWNNMPQTVIQNIILSMCLRCTACINAHLLVFTICLWGEQADRKHFDLGRCSIHNADIYIYSTTKEMHHLYFGKYFYNLFNNNIIDEKHLTCEDVIQWILVWTINLTFMVKKLNELSFYF
jgi:hypothetical protein